MFDTERNVGRPQQRNEEQAHTVVSHWPLPPRCKFGLRVSRPCPGLPPAPPNPNPLLLRFLLPTPLHPDICRSTAPRNCTGADAHSQTAPLSSTQSPAAGRSFQTPSRCLPCCCWMEREWRVAGCAPVGGLILAMSANNATRFPPELRMERPPPVTAPGVPSYPGPWASERASVQGKNCVHCRRRIIEFYQRFLSSSHLSYFLNIFW